MCNTVSLADDSNAPSAARSRRRRVGEQCERVVGVGGDNRSVEGPDAVVVVVDRHALGRAAHAAHRRRELGGGELLRRPFDVAPRSPDHGAPLGGAGDPQRAVVLEEGEQRARRIAQRGTGRARPHARDQRHHEMVDEVRRVAPGVEEVTEGDDGPVLSPAGLVGGEEPLGRPVEPLDLDQHPHVARARALAGWAKIPPSPRAPAYSRPQPSQRTDMLMSVGWVSTPSSPNNRSRLGYVLRLCTMKPLSIGRSRPSGVTTSWVCA